MNALIVVDVQNDFLPGGALQVPDGDRIIPVINRIQGNFDLVVATQDWHPEGHASFASQHEGKDPFDTIEWQGNEETIWPDHCVQGSEGAEFAPDLDLLKAEAIFRKGTDPKIDSYSGYFDNHHKRSTGLADYLRGKDVETVYLCGLAADICVYFTALDSLKEGFKTVLIEDATQALDQEDFKQAISDLKDKGGKVIRSGEL